MEFGGTLFAILLAELVFLALELAQLLSRRLQQWSAPARIVMRIFRHDWKSQSCSLIQEKAADREGSVPQDYRILAACGSSVFDARQPERANSGTGLNEPL